MIFWKPLQIAEENKAEVIKYKMDSLYITLPSGSTASSESHLSLRDVIEIFSYFKFELMQRLRFYLHTIYGIPDDTLQAMFPLDADAEDDHQLSEINNIGSSTKHKIAIISSYPSPESQLKISQLTCERDVRLAYEPFLKGFPKEYQQMSQDMLIIFPVTQTFQGRCFFPIPLLLLRNISKFDANKVIENYVLHFVDNPDFRVSYTKYLLGLIASSVF